MHIGVVGAGRIGAFHARTLASLPEVGRVTIADVEPSRGDVATADELLAAGVEAVVIATPTIAHAPLLRLAASAGLPAFCEKPVALELDVLDSVIADVARAGILVQVGFQRRFDDEYLAARDAVAAGAIGTLLVLRAATHDPAPPSEAYIAGSGGIFRDLHIHDLDAIRFVTGQEIVEVYAAGAVRETAWFAAYGDVDAAAAVLTLEGGALAVITGTRHDPLGYDVRLEVFGTADSLAIGLAGRVPVHAPGTPAVRGHADFLERFEAAYRAELAAFVATVRDGGPSACPLDAARAALAAAVAADRSRAERRPVRVGATSTTQDGASR
jgi:myo-inositol 2-dehydrogenase/D-chiro-inositol 1-dehydrogenase